MSEFDQVAKTLQIHEMIRKAVKEGYGEEALRLANKHRVPNEFRIDLGVETSNDPKKAPKLRIG